MQWARSFVAPEGFYKFIIIIIFFSGGVGGEYLSQQFFLTFFSHKANHNEKLLISS